MSEAQIARRKAEARAAARARRAGADPALAAALVTHFPGELWGLSPVAGYWPVGTEIDPRPLMAALAGRGAVLALPRLAAPNEAARFFAWAPGDPLEADAFGVPAPFLRQAELRPKLIFAPLLAFDRAGYRLGQGGGIYDRTIAVLRADGAIAVGLAYAVQEIPCAPTDAKDEPLDWVVTELGAIRRPPPQSPAPPR